MQIKNGIRPVLQADGVVRQVDPVARELEVLVAGDSVSFDVGPECVVTLRGERVKLRILQPRDRVRVVYARDSGTLVATAVDVRSGSSAQP